MGNLQTQLCIWTFIASWYAERFNLLYRSSGHFCRNVLSFLARTVLYQQRQVHQVFSLLLDNRVVFSQVDPSCAANRLYYSCCFCCCNCLFTISSSAPSSFSVVYLLHIQHSRPSNLPPSPSSILLLLPLLIRSSFLVYMRTSHLHRTSHFCFSLLVPDVTFAAKSCFSVTYSCWTCCNLEPVVLCTIFSRSLSFWSDERAGGRFASIHFAAVTRQIHPF